MLDVRAIRAAAARGDHRAALELVLARLTAGDALAIDEVIDALPGAPAAELVLGIVGHVTGDRAEALLAAFERGRFPAVFDLRQAELAALAAAWRLGDHEAIRARVTRQLRRLVRVELDEVAGGLAAWLVREVGDVHVTAEAKLFKLAGKPADGERALAALTAPVTSLALPVREHGPASAGLSVRVAERPGRNEPCHCGSGKKYKKCHADEDDAAAASGTGSPIAGMSWDDYLRAGADKLTIDDVRRLSLSELARVDLDRLRDKVLLDTFAELCQFRAWPLAIEAIAAVRRRTSIKPHVGDDLAAELAFNTLAVGDIDTTRAIVATEPEAASLPSVATELALRGSVDERAAALDQLEVLAKDVVTTGFDPHDLVSAVIGVLPALGIVVARGSLDAKRDEISEMLLDLVEDARDRLALPPGDPGWNQLDDLMYAAGLERGKSGRRQSEVAEAAAAERHKLAREAAELRSTLHAETGRAAKLESELARQRAAASAASARGPVVEVEPARVRELRDRIETLEAQIREGNDERAALRRQLAAAVAPVEVAPAAAPEPEPDVDDDGDALETTGRRGVLVPRFEDSALRSFGAVPVAVAAEAMKTIGELAAGEGLAWHRVKQARDMRTPLFMARVGIHHRLLFRVDSRLAVVELVPREGLLHALKRLRSA